ncbi:MAG: DUF4260 domain-containing protein [Chitinophagaceae bacterium]
MKTWLNTEELGAMLLCLAGIWYMNTGIAWYWWILLFFSPDISMLGYLGGNKAGAFLYNLFHHKGVGCVWIAVGIFLEKDMAVVAGLLLIAHCSFDRLMGYGLKMNEGFKHTHLGVLPGGKKGAL